jgi:hypothetical protein
LFGAALVAGVPYALMAVLVLWWLRSKSASALRRFSFALPPLFLGFLATSTLVSQVRDWGLSAIPGWLAEFPYLALFVLGTGYGYVLLAHTLFDLSSRAGWVRAARLSGSPILLEKVGKYP